ncbi:MAG: hypothetical protein JNL60_11160 [Bacteroidia bacterium]|nr:hypothetical protein [Bacteroidia bacterium]
MKYYLSITILLMLSVASNTYAQKKPAGGGQKKAVVSESKYFNFQSDPLLNAHLFLYNKAMTCKFKKTPNDSLVFVSFKDKAKGINVRELSVLNSVLAFYRDSLLSKDLLFDSIMRDFSDKLVSGNNAMIKYQVKMLEAVSTFAPYFTKLFWAEIESANKAWLKSNLPQIVSLENQIVPELEKIYQTKLPEGKIRVDLVDYATWAGAYSFNDKFCHVVFSTSHRSNQGELAPEVIFHEASHFMVDKLSEMIAKEAKGKDIKTSINLWHNMIFYTAGYVMEKELAKAGKKFVPFYEQMKFADKFSDFKYSVEACKQFWDPYCEGKLGMEEAVKQIVSYMLQKK